MARKIEIEIHVTRTGTGAEKATREIEKLDRAADKSQKTMSLQEKAMKGLNNAIGGLSFAAITAAVVKFANESTKAFSQFDKGVREVFTLLPGVTAAAKADIERQVLDMSTNIGRSTEEITTALYESLSANVPESDVFAFLEAASATAKGGVTSLAVVVDGLTSVINSYGMEAADATNISDILFQTVKFGKVRFEELSQNLSTVTPVAASLGIPLEEIGALLATITAKGTETSVAATQIRSALLDLSKGGGVASEAFQELTGKSFQEFIAAGGTVQGAFQILAAEAERTGVNLTDFFGRIEGGQAALQTTGTGAQLYASIFQEVANSTGSTQAAVDEFTGSLDESNRITQATIDRMKILVGEALTPAKIAWNEFVSDIASGVGQTVSAGQETADIMAGIAEATTTPQAEARRLALALNAAEEAINDAGIAGMFMGGITEDFQGGLRDVALSTIEVERGFQTIEEQGQAVFTAMQDVYGSSVTMTNGLIYLDGAAVGTATLLYEMEEATQAAEAAQRELIDTNDRLATQQRFTLEGHVAEVQATYELSDAYAELQERQILTANATDGVSEAIGTNIDALEDGTEATEEQTSAWEDALSGAAKYAKALGDIDKAMANEGSSGAARLERTIEQSKADKEATEALVNYNKQMSGYYQAALDAETGAGLYNTAISNIGTSTSFVSNLTGEQALRLQALQSEYNNVTTQLEAYRIGTEGIYLTDEERATQMQELGEKAAFLAEQMGPLNEAGGEYVERTTEATFNTEAVSNALYDAALASGASAEDMALLGLALGTVSEAEAEAALKAAILREKIEAIAKAYADPESGITAEEAAAMMRDAITDVEGLSLAFDTAAGSVQNMTVEQGWLADATQTEIDKITVLSDKLGLLPEETGIKVNVDTAEAEARLDSLLARLNQLGSGGQPGWASGGNQSSPDPLTPRAAGGPVSGGTAYQVGEHGPEMYQSPNYNAIVGGGTFIPPENGSIIPAGTTKSYMDRSTRNVTIYGNADLTAMQQAFTQEQRQRSRF